MRPARGRNDRRELLKACKAVAAALQKAHACKGHSKKNRLPS